MKVPFFPSPEAITFSSHGTLNGDVRSLDEWAKVVREAIPSFPFGPGVGPLIISGSMRDCESFVRIGVELARLQWHTRIVSKATLVSLLIYHPADPLWKPAA